MKKRSSLKAKVIGIGIFILCVFVFSLVFIALRIQQTVIAERTVAMENLVETVAAILSFYEEAQAQGTLTLSEAQQKAMQLVRTIRYAENDYFFILDVAGRMIVQPYQQELEGKEVSAAVDTRGGQLYQEMMTVCKTHGKGHVRFWMQKPGSTLPMKKISYVQLFRPWNWIIGTGFYIDDLVQKINFIRLTLIWLIVFLSVGLVILFYWFVRSVSQPINTATKGLSHIGDQVSQAADQVASSSQILAQASSEQAASLEETSSSLEQMSSMTKNNADHALQADILMKDVTTVVGDARLSMNALETSMQDIAKSSADISRIIKTIDEIAFQTNLLALNAAVEAARAGEAGAGFAVVADEVRSLAMRAAEAAKSTGSLIENTVSKVQDGTTVMQRANEAFENVSRKAAQAAQLVAEIAAASREQAEGIAQINHVVAQMDKVIQQNAANAEESASAAEELKAQSEYLKNYIGVLQALVHGTTAAQAALPATTASRTQRKAGGGDSTALLSSMTADENTFKTF